MLIFCYEDTTTRITVDTMDEGWTKRETIILASEIVLYLINKVGFLGLVISSMDTQSRRFVDYHEKLVFVENQVPDLKTRNMRCGLRKICSSHDS